jgi:glycine/D-amino acid oxidase-like deaminating enzyme/nitrite reductase/ring-hydroxylating ferredoxin subunit
MDYDVVIIGGGIAGLWCAYNLVRAGKKVCVIEAKTVGLGTTSGSTAIFTYAQDIIYGEIIKKHGEAAARKYIKDTKTAISDIAEIIKTEKFDCDFEPIDFVLYTTRVFGKCALKKEQRAYKKLGEDIKSISSQLPFKTKYCLKFDGNFQINPLKLCMELANYIVKNGGKIIEKTLVTNAPDGETLLIGDTRITSKHFIVASHFPYINVPGFYWLKMYQEQNYCMSFTTPKGFENFCIGTSYESIDKGGFEYRRIGKEILIDGVPVRTGEKPFGKYEILQRHIGKYFGAKYNRKYCAQDCITFDKLPYAGRYSHFADNVFVVTGFNKWGMTNSYICANVVCDMVKGKLPVNSPFSKNIYSPQRTTLSPIKAATNLGVVASSFANNLLNLDAKKFKRIKPNGGAVIKYKGHRIGASRDADGKVHLISAICPHLGCNLKWNKDERTFDCPCHGSRFDTKGKIISNPSTKNAEQIRINFENGQ